jgi:hypothetical protein
MPTIRTLPTITGKAKVGQYLREKSGGRWISTTKLTTTVLSWQRCNASGRKCASIPSFHAKSYLVRPIDIGHRLRLLVAVSNAAGRASAASRITSIVARVPPLMATRHTGKK